MSLLERYGLWGVIRLARDVMFSKFVFPQARIIRRPFYIRGKSYIKIGRNFTCGVGLRMDVFSATAKPCLMIGENVQMNDYVHITACDSVRIGNNVLIASKVFITDHNHGSYGFQDRHDSPDVPPIKRELSWAPVVIGDNVWLGEFVAVLAGVKIGQGSLIGAMSVVTKDIPPFCIAVGCPAKVIKRYNFESKRWERI